MRKEGRERGREGGREGGEKTKEVYLLVDLVRLHDVAFMCGPGTWIKVLPNGLGMRPADN